MYVYKYDYALNGYVNFTLAWAPNGTTSEPCRYTVPTSTISVMFAVNHRYT